MKVAVMPPYLFRSYRIVPVHPSADPASREGRGHGAAGHGFAPPTDVAELPEGFVVRMEVAGLRPEDVEVTVGDDARTVTVTGTRAPAPTTAGARLLNMEIDYGRFDRRLVLPAEIDGPAATATCQDGFLIVTLPLLRKVTVRRSIPVERG
jgi:HSP20 family protein